MKAHCPRKRSAMRRFYTASAVLTVTVVLLAACSAAKSVTASVSPPAKSAGSVSPSKATTPSPSPSPSPSLVYVGPGVAIVGITPDDYQGTDPSHLYLSTDMVRWKDVTPPQSVVAQNSGYSYFVHASFLNSSAGSVTAWNPSTLVVTIYRTSNRGKTWTAVSGGDPADSSDILVELLRPTT